MSEQPREISFDLQQYSAALADLNSRAKITKFGRASVEEIMKLKDEYERLNGEFVRVQEVLPRENSLDIMYSLMEINTALAQNFEGNAQS